MNWFVYIVECKDKSLYTGITNDVSRRLWKHNNKHGAASLRGKLPVKVGLQGALYYQGGSGA